MPNLPMHIYLAHQVAEQLDWGYVYDHIGSFYLGSTSPDIRAMTKWPREQTHFAPLSVREVGTGTRTMFRNYPELLDESEQSRATRTFLLGYVCHLAADEVWITTVYRPNFDISSEDTRLTVRPGAGRHLGQGHPIGHGSAFPARRKRPAERRAARFLRRHRCIGRFLRGRPADPMERAGVQFRRTRIRVVAAQVRPQPDVP